MPANAPPRTEDEVEQATTSLLGKQGPFRPTVRLLEHDGGTWVAKDYRACTPLYRWTVGVWNLRRERSALRRLHDVEGVPHIEATVGRWIDIAPEAIFVCTSRIRLHLPGEQILVWIGRLMS